MAKADEPREGTGPGWRHRAVSKSLSAARTRAEQRVQGLLDAAFELIDERGTTQFTIQEVVDRLRAFRDAGATDLAVRVLPFGRHREARIQSRERTLAFLASLCPEL